ncbi:co-regulatory protein PtrA N-terminal domain-containing protein [Pseudomonas sp.]|uniref:co-regulatory protein PtrA N-terminal domain-containing protein n=1 Tax=Pseudomonas sp. TaxID=306 RepID=UPI003A96B492
MKILNALLITAVLITPSLAMAEGGGDRTFVRMQAASERSTQSFQLASQQQQKTTITTTDQKHSHSNC